MYDEFTKISIHNHIGGASAERKIDERYDKVLLIDYTDVVNKLKDAKDNNFQLLAFTNANVFSLNDYITSRIIAKEFEIELLPGIEINVSNKNKNKYLHVVIVFNPISNLLLISKLLENFINENQKNFITISQLVELLIEQKAIIIPHGIKQSNGEKSSSTNPEQFKEIIAFSSAMPVIMEDNKKYHKESLKKKLEEFLNSSEMAWLDESESVSSADRTKYSNIESPTFIWGNKSFNDLYFAALMKKTRIKRESDIITKACYISKIYIKSINEDSQIQETEIVCSHGLNSIIGKSGSGKTLLLNAIKNSLTGENLTTKASGVSQYDGIYKDVKFILKDAYGNEINKSSNWKVFEGDNLYNKILSAYLSNKNKLLEELKLELDVSNFNEIISKFSKEITDYKNKSIQIKKIEKETNNYVTSMFSNIAFLNDNRNLSVDSIEYLKNSELITKQSDFLNILDEYKKDLIMLGKIKKILIDMSLKYEMDNNDKIEDLYNEYKEKIVSKEQKILLAELNIKEQILLEKNLYEIVKKYNDTLGKKLSSIIEKRQEILFFIEQIKNNLKLILELNSKMKMTTLKKEYFNDSIKLSDNEFSRITISSINLEFERTELDTLLENCVGRSNTKINMSSFPNTKFNLENEDSVKSLVDVFIDNEYNLDISFSFDYNIYLKYNIELKKSNNEFENIESMSAGELGKTYISNMIDRELKNGGSNLIVLFDQPDNNLEKKFILDELIKKIDYMRNHFQVFITTHEPLLVVNADSNNIIKAENKKTAVNIKNDISYENLSFVDKYNTKNQMIDKISEMVDGSYKAVKTRTEIYGGMLDEINS